jgi:hypothetical protein
VIFGDTLQHNEYYLHFLQLVKIFRLLIRDEFNEQSLLQIEDIIDAYFKDYQQLYKDVSFIPKQHFMVHYARQIKEFGPMKHLWVMRFESKHGYFKQTLRAVHNFKNITFSLTKNHQELLVLQLQQTDYLVQTHGTQIKLKIDSFKSRLNTNSNNISIYKWISLDGITFRANDAITVSKDKDQFMFGVVVNVVVLEKRHFYINYKSTKNLGLVSHLQSYLLEIEDKLNLIRIEDLHDKATHDLYPHVDGKVLLPPKYIVSVLIFFI